MKSGFVSIVGRPNVGKSSLLNSMLERKVAIISNVAGTTRNIIQGIYNDDECQIVFVDTPGIHKPKDKLGNHLNKKAYQVESGSDLILFVIDASKGFGKGDKFILDRIKDSGQEIILLLNKVDLVKKEKLLAVIAELSSLYDFAEIFPISALKGDNVEELIKTIKKYLPEGNAIYDESVITNISKNFAIAELVREKILHYTKEEVPHAVTCMVEEFEEDEETADISVLIIVSRKNLKKIIIGKNGDMLKKVGTEARLDIEELLGKKVYLKTYVKTIDNWRDSDKLIKELDLDEEI